jgi:hypothetical protein
MKHYIDLSPLEIHLFNLLVAIKLRTFDALLMNFGLDFFKKF